MPPPNLPVPAPEANVVLEAIARAAAEIAAQGACQRSGSGLDREAVEEIVDEAITEAFKKLGIDLGSVESIDRFRDSLRHARQSSTWLDLAAKTMVGTFIAALAGLVIAAFSKYAAGGFK